LQIISPMGSGTIGSPVSDTLFNVRPCKCWIAVSMGDE
jgi:hypothetical protein